MTSYVCALREHSFQGLMQEAPLKSEALEVTGKTSNLNAAFNWVFSHS